MVPLTMPATREMRLACSPRCKVEISGMPPPTAASKKIVTLWRLARSKISGPCLAINSLLAVTICLPLAIARLMTS